MSIVLPLAIVGGLAYVLVNMELNQAARIQVAADQKADLQAFYSLEKDDPARALGRIEGYVETAGRRPGSTAAALMTGRGVVVASSSGSGLGQVRPDAAVQSVLRGGRAFIGPDPDAKAWQSVVRLRLNGRRFIYSLGVQPLALDALASHVKAALLSLGVLALLLGTALFYLLGGRSLMRSHGKALERAWLDGLTDLPNRRAFEVELADACEAAQHDGSSLSLLALDIDDFRSVNSRQGQAEGDRVLRTAASLLSGEVAAAYRTGNDEFAVICLRPGPEASVQLAGALSCALEERGISVTCGISTYTHASSAELLQAEAAAALTESRRRGERIGLYDDMRDDLPVTSVERQDALRRLLDQRRVSTVFQPIWDLEESRLMGIEALSRPDPDCGISDPSEAFTIAALLGRTRSLDQVCIGQALATVPHLEPDQLVFLNLSPHSLDGPEGSVDWMVEAVQAVGLRTSQVVVEVTEEFSGRTAAVVRSLHKLRAQGFQLALDDVGSGNSGLAILRDLAPDFVKLDRSIVSSASRCPNARGVLLAMATFACETGAFVIAEGIEDAATLSFLRALHLGEFRSRPIINGGQGFGLGRPACSLPGGLPALLGQRGQARRAEILVV